MKQKIKKKKKMIEDKIKKIFEKQYKEE